MSSMIRSFKRNQLKNEIKSNEIQDLYHERYGFKPNKTKIEMKLEQRRKRKSLKDLWKFLREKRKNKEEK